MTEQEITEAVARGWCSPKNEHKVMDSDLAYAIVEEIVKINKTPNLGYATTRELLVELSARTEVDGSANYRTVSA